MMELDFRYQMEMNRITSNEENKNNLGKEIKMDVCLSTMFILMALLVPIGYLRRRHRNSLLQVFGWGVYTGTTLLIPYVFGLLQSVANRPTIWLVLLVYVYGSVDKVNALSLSDRSSVIVIWVKNFLHFSLALYFVVCYLEDFWSPKELPAAVFFGYLVICAVILGELVITFYKVVERVVASQYAIGDVPSLTSLVLIVSNSMGYNPIADNWVVDVDPADDPSPGCRYVVDPRCLIANQAITMDRILVCEDGSILSSTRDSTCQLKNTCLSFSLFWLLLHKFAGVPSYESSHKEAAWKFVKHGLLKRPTPLAFRVVEVELGFLYDFFYTKYFYFYVKGFWCQLVKHVLFHVTFTLHTVTLVYVFVFLAEKDDVLKHRFLITLSVLVIIIAMEVVQFIAFLRSNWSKMMLICVYRKRESWKKQTIWDCCINFAAKCVYSVRSSQDRKPWQRKLGQYSLLDSFSSQQHLLWKISSALLHAVTGIRFLKPGRKQIDGIALSKEIEEALIQSLEDRGPRFTKGFASLKANYDQLAPAITTKLITAYTNFRTDAQVILAWHIATSLCEMSPQLPLAAREGSDFRVATSLSKYCAYLVAFAPNMLPGNAAITDRTCTWVIEDAYTRMKDCEAPNMYCRLMEIAESEGDQANILRQGAVLGKVLETEIMEQGIKWKVLADFWGELILYVAPNACNEWAHAERLADGGEFISHLWVLLFHAGIVDRDFEGWPAESEANI